MQKMALSLESCLQSLEGLLISCASVMYPKPCV